MSGEPIRFLEAGKWRRGETARCRQCQADFVRRIAPCKGREKKAFCSSICAKKATRTRRSVLCGSCGAPFERAPTKIDKSKSGLVFCSDACRLQQFRIGGLLAPNHFGTAKTGRHAYWRAALEAAPCECVDCGLSFKAVLTIHHIDGNRENNASENLEILCGLHHAIRHMKKKDGLWTYDTSALTPRDCLAEVWEIVRKESFYA